VFSVSGSGERVPFHVGRCGTTAVSCKRNFEADNAATDSGPDGTGGLPVDDDVEGAASKFHDELGLSVQCEGGRHVSVSFSG
jgi:hypothetical protein